MHWPDMISCPVDNKKKAKYVEIFCPPRVALELQEWPFHYSSSEVASVDLSHGFDLREPVNKQQLVGRVQHEEPTVTMLCPPCRFFGTLMFRICGG